MLDTVNLSQTLKKKAYKPVRKALIERIFDLSEIIYEQKRPVVIAFEGWDAAGKGTTIRQLTAPLDARGFKVLATQAPRTHETRKPWLWRFWMNIPRHGQIAIFDRSWYGRVLVERVNGLTPMPQWIASYEEINNFERTLTDDGTIFIKLWLHISKDEQLRRFLLLASEPETAWQVTAEDWENHRKYDEFRAAVTDMLQKTSTPVAPWAVVPANDGDVRHYTVSAAIIARLENALGLSPTEWPSLDELSDEETKKDKKPGKKNKEQKAQKEKPANSESPAAQSDGNSKTTKKAKDKVGKRHGGAAAEAQTVAPAGDLALASVEPASPEATTAGSASGRIADTAPPERQRKQAPAKRAALANTATDTATEVDHA